MPCNISKGGFEIVFKLGNFTRSSFPGYYSLLIIHYSSDVLTIHHSPFTIHYSPLTTHHSRLTIHDVTPFSNSSPGSSSLL